MSLERYGPSFAIRWFEAAAAALARTADAAVALLYDLADMLEEVADHARALAMSVDLEPQSGGSRDVVRRVNRLLKVRAKG